MTRGFDVKILVAPRDFRVGIYVAPWQPVADDSTRTAYDEQRTYVCPLPCLAVCVRRWRIPDAIHGGDE